MEENREQPIIMPATALNPAETEEKTEENIGAMSEVGSHGDLGKFKSVQALMDAYNSLQVEFTKKCQALSELKKDKTEEISQPVSEEIGQSVSQKETDEMEQFLSQNAQAKEYANEIKELISQNTHKNKSPYELAWANVLLDHLKAGDDEQVINQYVLSNESVKNKIIESYLQELSSSKPPVVMSSQSGERVSGVIPDAPKSLSDAKKLVNKMFS